MRILKVDEIVCNKYSIENGRIVENGNGEFFNKQIANQVLIYQQNNDKEAIKKLKLMDFTERENYANKICLDRYVELKNENNFIYLFENEPQKKYEIFRIKLNNKEKLMLTNTKYYTANSESELYYDKQIALEIYDNMIELEGGVENSFPELIEFCQEEINKKTMKIEKLKKEDIKKFNNAKLDYELIHKSETFQQMKNAYELSRKEIKDYKVKLENASNNIENLTKKLKIALDRVEQLQKERKVGFLEKILGIFNRQKRLKN